MLRSITKSVVVEAGEENTEDVIVGKDSPRITIEKVWFQQTDDTDLRGYVDTDRVIDVASECDAADTNGVPVEIDLAAGQTFKIGFHNATIAQVTKHATVFYKEV